MPKNILVLHASPRLNGNSHTLAETFITGAEAAGNWVKRINVALAKVEPCTACEYCRTHEHQCCQDDDMQRSIHRSSVLTALFWQRRYIFMTGQRS